MSMGFVDLVASEVYGGVKIKQRSSCLRELQDVRAESKPAKDINMNLTSLNDTSAHFLFVFLGLSFSLK